MTADILETMRARLAEIETALVQLRQLEEERVKLARAIAAYDNGRGSLGLRRDWVAILRANPGTKSSKFASVAGCSHAQAAATLNLMARRGNAVRAKGDDGVYRWSLAEGK